MGMTYPNSAGDLSMTTDIPIYFLNFASKAYVLELLIIRKLLNLSHNYGEV